jgi:hypothetical protein
MANKSLLTYGSKVGQVEQSYYAPTAVLPITNLPINATYVFLSKVEPWVDEFDPPQPTQDQQYIKSVHANMFVAKKVLTNNISPVIQRINWTPGRRYDYYQDDVDMFEVDANGYLIREFYVKNRFDQVFKCLWNNTGTISTEEPFFKPGNYGTNNIFQDVDGYKWKYVYTIDAGSKKTFMDTNWMPVPVGSNIPNPLENGAGYGNIDVINVVSGGSGYDTANATITMEVTGDGIGATGTLSITDGIITDVTVVNRGTNYTYAGVSVISDIGSGAIFTAPVSPIGGHGFDNVSELGCTHIMLTAEFNGSENGYIPIDIDYRQAGILVNPTSLSTAPNAANGSIYKATTDLIVASGFGSFVPDEILYQGDSVATASFKATVLSFDVDANVVKLINIKGTPATDSTVYGNVSLTARTLLGVSNPDFVPYSGYLAFIQNRTSVQRSSDGIEQFKFVLGY